MSHVKQSDLRKTGAAEEIPEREALSLEISQLLTLKALILRVA